VDADRDEAEGQGVADAQTVEHGSVPESLGPYRIEAVIGTGAMGTVFRATHTGLDRVVALKVMRPDTLQDRDAVRRFLREGRAIARLEHPHIVAVYDAGEIDGVYYLAMKYLEGETLQQIVSRSGPPSTDRAVRLGSQLSSALHYAHGRGVIHRDVKPANIIVGEGDLATLTDFGIAVAVQAGTAHSTVVAGTPLYMSPEQIGGKETDGRSDIYSLGAVLYELCAGKPPFDGPMVQVMYAHMQTAPPDLRSLAPAAPETLVRIIERALAKDPNERFQSAGEMAQALARIGGEGTFDPGATLDRSAAAGETAVIERPAVSTAVPTSAPASGTRARGIPWPVLVAAPVVLLAVLAAAFFVLGRGGATTGGLRIVSSPPGASVSVDGVARGKTPVSLTGLKPGRHIVTLALATYKATSLPVAVSRGKTLSVTPTLASLPAARLMSKPTALLATSFRTDAATHKVTAGAIFSSAPVRGIQTRTVYVLAEFHVPSNMLTNRSVTFRPGYQLVDPNGLVFARSPRANAITLQRGQATKVWEAAFRISGKSPPPGTYTVRITADGASTALLHFRLTP
jgi:tRNA A-37 threonylcarbamoyl transferase component Bud32